MCFEDDEHTDDMISAETFLFVSVYCSFIYLYIFIQRDIIEKVLLEHKQYPTRKIRKNVKMS